MYVSGIHKLRTIKEEEGSVQKCISIVLVTPLFAKVHTRGRQGSQN